MSNTSTKDLKAVAKAIAEQLEGFGYGKVQHTHMLTALSKVHGFSAWNAIAASGAVEGLPKIEPAEPAPVDDEGIWIPGQRDDEYFTYGIEVTSREFGSELYRYLTPMARLRGLERLMREARAARDGIAREYYFARNEQIGDDITDYTNPEVVFELYVDGSYRVSGGRADVEAIAETVYGPLHSGAMCYGMKVVGLDGVAKVEFALSAEDRREGLYEMLLAALQSNSKESLAFYFNTQVGLSEKTWKVADEVKVASFNHSSATGPWVMGYIEEVAPLVKRARLFA